MKTTFLRSFAFTLVLIAASSQLATAQLQVINGTTAPYTPPSTLIQNVLLGQGVTLVGTPVFSGDPVQVGYFNGSTTNIGLSSGIIMASANCVRAIGPNNNGGGGNTAGGGNTTTSTATDANLLALSGGTTMDDICKFDFDFIPLADTLRFRYVFASEEYREFVCSGFNDVFGFFVSGPRPASQGGGNYNNFNIATVPGTTTPVSIDNINNGGSGFGTACPPPGVNSQYYTDNPSSGTTTIQYDGFTTVLTAIVVVTPCQQYHIKLALGDVGDDAWDSAVFLEASSFGTGVINTSVVTTNPDGIIEEGGTNGQVCFSISQPRNIGTAIPYQLLGTATPNVDYTVSPATLIIPAGQTQACLNIIPIDDAIAEGTESIRIGVQTSACRRDTFTISLIDKRIVPPIMPNQALCPGSSAQLDASQAVIVAGPRIFTNNTSGAITCACPAGATPGPPLLSTINVSGVPGNFNVANTQLQVCLNITHTNDSDLDIYLIDPCGDVLELTTDNGGGGDNYNNTCFTVAVAPNITTGTAPFTGNFAPEGNWSALNGCALNGNWRLQVGDDSNPTNGTLTAWSMTFPPSYNVNYSWSPTTNLSCTTCSNPVATPATNTIYTVTVADSYGASVTGSVNVTRVTNLPPPVISCGTPTNGSVTFDWTTIGGASGYEVAINGGAFSSVATATTFTQSGLTPGQTVSVIVHAVGACPAQDANFTCSVPTSCALAATAAAPAISCNGGTTTITVTATGPTGAVTYALGAGAQQSSNTFSNIVAGNYTITVRDAGNCSNTTTINIINPTLVTANAIAIDSVSCLGGSDGKATVVAAGGTGPYTYSWCSGGTSNSVNNLVAGTCTVIVNDALGCPAGASVTIFEPAFLSATVTQTDSVSCFGGGDGKAIINAVGGTAPYHYGWDNTGTAQTNITLSAGLHFVTVTDVNGCIAFANVTILQPAVITATATRVDSVSCFGGSDGKAIAGQAGGTAPYNYQWDSNELTQTAVALTAGTHSVTVTDTNGCSATANILIRQPIAISAIATMTDSVSCFGGGDGKATVVGAGGTAPYHYLWDNANAGQSPTNLTAGAHTVIVTDVNGCSIIATATLLQPLALVVTVMQTDSVSCFGGNDGKASVTVTNGTAPYQYSWDIAGITTANPITLTAGLHTVTVTDVNGCNQTATITITQPLLLTATAIQTDSVSCFGGNDGKALVTGMNGTAPYHYLWDNAATTPNNVTLLAGTHFVTVTDVNGCIATASVTILQPAILAVLAAQTDSVSCFGGNDGKAIANVTGGTTPYQYFWDSGELTQNAILLNNGIHTVNITDVNGCLVSNNVTILQPNILTATATMTDSVRCNGENNGQAIVNPVGGTSPYHYLWDNAETTQTAVALTAGTHTVIATDVNGCSVIATTTLLEPAPLTATTTLINGLLCANQNNGSAAVTPLGGTAPYHYLWNNSNTNTQPVDLAGGTNTVVVTDVNGCTTSATVIVTTPTPLSITATLISDITCSGATNGSAQGTASGGTLPYSYLWDNGTPTDIANNLDDGTRTVVVTDGNGCTASTTIVISEPQPLFATATMTDSVSCNGGNDGKATVVTTGGNSPYTYNWDSSELTQTAIALSAGSHNVVVTDAGGCLISATVIILQPDVLAAIAIMTDSVSCATGSDGKANVVVMGGTQPYRYLWDNLNNTQAPSDLTTGSHCVTITDVNSCTTIACVTIAQPVLLTAVTTMTSVLCNGGSTGTATVTPSGGTAPYHYQWSAAAQNTLTATNLAAGIYTVTATDVNGCTTIATIDVIAPTVITLTTTQTDVLCNGNLSGTATVNATGGTTTQPYAYIWSDPATQQTATTISLGAGSYTVTVTDGNNCTQTTGITITQPSALGVQTAAVNVSCNSTANGSITSVATGGITPYNTAWNTLGGQTTGLGSGTYTVTITDANACTVTATANVQEPSLLVLTTTQRDITCFGANNGEISVLAQGGSPTYTYMWNVTLPTDPTVTGLPAGTYTVTVTDINACAKSISVNISEPTDIALLLTQIPPKCTGGTDGSATVVASGGGANYTYNWSTIPAQTNATANNLIAGAYSVTVTDGTGCMKAGQAVVTDPLPLALQMTADSVRCNGEQSGTAIASVQGGTSGNNGGYNYAWSGAAAAQNTPAATNLGAGVYTVTVSDANLCTIVGSTEVYSLSTLTLTTSSVATTCFGYTNGTATVIAGGGRSDTTYTYAWTAPIGIIRTATAGALAAGNYVVTVTDANGCTATASADVLQPQILTTASKFSTDISCKGGADGTATIVPQGGTEPYVYAWNSVPPQTDPTAVGLPVGDYNVTVTDANSCSFQAVVRVSEPATNVSATATYTEPRCYGGNDGTATVTPAGGTITATAGYTYLWDNGQTTQTAVSMNAGTHTVIVTDTKGCTAITSVLVRQPASISLTFPSSTPPACKDGRDGMATVLAGGGTPNYTYTWNTIPVRNGASISGLIGGATYIVTATDVLGCIGYDSIKIAQPAAITLTLQATPAGCFQSANGMAAALANGGSPAFSYLWNNGQTTATAQNLIAGVYNVTVTDSRGCTLSASTIVVQGSTLNIRSQSESVRCNGDNTGSASVVVTGGAPVYQYAWSNGILSQSPVAINLPQGTYTVTVSDYNRCTITSEITVTEPPLLTATATSINAVCAGNLNGSIHIDVQGGTSPYQYSFNGGNIFGGSTNLIGINAGTYPIAVRDHNGCLARDTMVITEPVPFTVSVGSDVTIEYEDYVTLTAAPSEPIGTVSFLWSAVPSDSSLVVSNMPSITVDPRGNTYYTVVATNANGCTATDKVLVHVEATRRVFVANGITPNNDKTNDVLFVQGGKGTERVITLRVYDRWGELIYQATDTPLNDPKYGWDGTFKGQSVDPGVFIWTADIKFTDGQTQTYKGDVTVLK